MGRIVRVSLGTGDDAIKTWWQLALDEAKNVSAIISTALYYYDLTGEYINIGNISNPEKGLPNVRKVVSLTETEAMLEIINKCDMKDKISGIGPTIKRVVRKGISGDKDGNYVIGADDLIDILNAAERKAAQKKPADMTLRQSTVRQEPVHDTIAETITEEQPKGQKKKEEIKKKSDTPKSPNFMLGLIPEGCGLGE